MRRITKARIKFISLVERGANRMPVIYKADTGALDIDMLTKASERFDEKGELYTVVYAPEHRDSQGDIASAEVIKEMAYEAMRTGVEIDVRHNEQPLDKSKAFVAESFIIQKGDPRFADIKDYDGNAIDVTGAWGAVLKIDDPDLRKQYREGKWNGTSMGGTGQVQVEKADDFAKRIADALASRINNDGEITMTGDELKTALKENNESLIKGLGEVIVKAIKPEDGPATPPAPEAKPEDKDKAEEAPVFKGEPTAENLRKHKIAIKRFNIKKAIDWNDEESIEKAAEALEELDKAEANAGKTETPEKDAEVARLEKELAAARKRSNQPAGDPAPTDSTLTKEEQECIAAGQEMAMFANSNRTLSLAS